MAENDDYDSPWKEAMAVYLRDFFEFFFPYIVDDIDWSKSPVFLDTKLRQMEREANLGKREADALIEVHRLEGEEAWVLVHIEVQAQKDRDFPLRMFVSNYRIFDMFRKPVCSLAILADKSRTWRPNSFIDELWGATMSLRFPSRKLQDFNTPEELVQLEQSTNPFAHLVAATLCAQATRPHSKEREQKKYRLGPHPVPTAQQSFPIQNPEIRRGEQNAVHYQYRETRTRRGTRRESFRCRSADAGARCR